jgi:hypothetical protein
MPNVTYAVLVADIVSSTSRPDLRGLLGEKLRTASHAHLKQDLIRLPYSVTAGDEFQAIIQALSEVPSLILDLRRRLRPLSFRAGIGIGRVTGRIQAPVNRIGGEAFIFARRAIEDVKIDSSRKFDVLTAFRSRDKVFDTTANLIYALHDTLVLSITEKQWHTIGVYWNKKRLEDAARELHLDISTVSRNLKRAYFWQLEQTIEGMKALLTDTFS